MTDDQRPDAIADGEDSASDPLLLALRAAAGQLDPVPPAFKAAAKATLSWQTVDAELAELTFDSLAEAASELVRGGQRARLLSFETPELGVELEVLSAGARRRVAGQLDPPQPAEVKLRQAHGTVPVEADQLGRFMIEVDPGPISLWCRAHTDPQGVLVTAWVAI
jgi:hypothetical protein